MKKTISFVRINKYNPKYVETQKRVIKEYVANNDVQIDEEIEIEINLAKEEQNIINLFKSCTQPFNIIVSDLNVFGRTTESILEVIRLLVKKKIRVISINQNIDLIDDEDMLTQMVLGVINITINLEKELMSLRTKEALNAKKAEGVNLGKPKGTIQKSKFDQQRDKIEELLSVGLSVRKIAKLLGYNNHIGLNNYVKKRNIRLNQQQTLL